MVGTVAMRYARMLFCGFGSIKNVALAVVDSRSAERVCLDILSGFLSHISQKRRREASPFLAQLFILLFRTCENFRHRPLRVRSPGYGK